MWRLDDLPLHPLIVHAPVILIPLLAAGMALFVFWPAARRVLGPIVVVIALSAAASAILAVETGEQLVEALRRGDTADGHAARGELARLVTMVMTLGTIGVGRGSSGRPRRSGHGGPFTIRAGAAPPTVPPPPPPPTDSGPQTQASPATSPSDPPSDPAPVDVAISVFAFDPPEIRIPLGTEVVWTNRDPAPHTATGEGFDTGTVATDGSASIVFDTPGTFAYFCAIHPSMIATLVVES